MRFLLDTHSFLWFIGGDEQLPLAARQVIAEIDHEIFLSIASLWEIAIKVSLGKLGLRKPFDELIVEQLSTNDIKVLPIDIGTLSLVTNLQFHHRDPFDRLIIAQAILEKMPIIGKDSEFARYPVDLVWKSYPV